MPFIENQECWYAETQLSWRKQNEIHIWSMHLSKDLKDIDLQLTYLSSEEKERAEKFYFAKDKIRFIQNRYLLRSIIAKYLDIQISEVEFKYNKYGKPQLANDVAKLFFNISHSNGLTVLAFSREYELGIDVELVKREEGISDFINTDIFTPGEINWLKSQNGSNISEACYKLWSAKEAYVKALGIGLTIPLNTIELNIARKDSISLLSAKADSYESYYLIELQNIHHDYIGTLALPEKTACVKYITSFNSEHDIRDTNKLSHIKDYSLLSLQQYEQIVYQRNQTYKDYPRDKTIHQLFEEQVERTPDSTALIYEEVRLTYKQLNERANKLANDIRQTKNIESGALVALCLDRNEHMLIAILAILKTGGAYVPIDPTYPDERIGYVLEDTATKIVLTNEIHKLRINNLISSALESIELATIITIN